MGNFWTQEVIFGHSLLAQELIICLKIAKLAKNFSGNAPQAPQLNALCYACVIVSTNSALYSHFTNTFILVELSTFYKRGMPFLNLNLVWFMNCLIWCWELHTILVNQNLGVLPRTLELRTDGLPLYLKQFAYISGVHLISKWGEAKSGWGCGGIPGGSGGQVNEKC